METEVSISRDSTLVSPLFSSLLLSSFFFFLLLSSFPHPPPLDLPNFKIMCKLYVRSSFLLFSIIFKNFGGRRGKRKREMRSLFYFFLFLSFFFFNFPLFFLFPFSFFFFYIFFLFFFRAKEVFLLSFT